MSREPSDLTYQGIEALNSGDKERARQLLGDAVRQNPEDIQAWLWLSGAVETNQMRVTCLRQALRLDPDNPVANRGVALMVAQGAVPAQVISDLPRGKGSPRAYMEARNWKQEEILFSAHPSLRSFWEGSVCAVASSILGLSFTALLLWIGRHLSIWLPHWIPGGYVDDTLVWAFLRLATILEQAVLYLTVPYLAQRIFVRHVIVILPSMAFGTFVGMFLGAGGRGVVIVLIASLLLSVEALSLIALVLLRYTRTRYILTTGHLGIAKWAVFGRSTKVIPLRWIKEVYSSQSVFQGMVGIGDVVIVWQDKWRRRKTQRLVDLPDHSAYYEVLVGLVENRPEVVGLLILRELARREDSEVH